MKRLAPGAVVSLLTALLAAALAAVAARTEGTAGWLRPDDLTAARRQAEGLGTLYPGSGEPLDVLRGYADAAAQANDPTDAVRCLSAVTAATDAPDVSKIGWRDFFLDPRLRPDA